MDLQEFAYSAGVHQNAVGGFYRPGKEFSKEKWVEIVAAYLATIEKDGKCSPWKLRQEAKISNHSALKAIAYYEAGIIPAVKRGHNRSGVGAFKSFEAKHDAYIYILYSKNPSRPIESYITKLRKKFGIDASESLITRWFHQVGPFKGTMRATSKFPPAKDTWLSVSLVERYCDFMTSITDHSNVIFADEKPMKEIDIHGKVRRNIMTGDVPTIQCNANSKNRWNIIAACSVKKGLQRALEFIMIDATGDAHIFRLFIAHLIKIGFMERGDILVVDNCTLHFAGENSSLQESLWTEAGF